jgi:endopolyphosphatase
MQFFFLEAIDLELPAIGAVQGRQPHTAREDLYETLIHDFGELPGKKKVNEAQFAVVNVNPSVVPNPYVPAFRIFSYNATGAADYNGTQLRINKDRKHGHPRGPKVDKKRCKDEPWRDTWRCHLTEKWHSDPESPVRTNTLWTPLGFAQVGSRFTESRLATRDG